MKRLLAALAIVLLLASTVLAAYQATFAWDASDRADYYTLHMIDPSGVDSILADNITSTTTEITHEVTESGDYQFYVTATNGYGTSGQSNVVMVDLGLPPGPPINFTVTVVFVP